MKKVSLNEKLKIDSEKYGNSGHYSRKLRDTKAFIYQKRKDIHGTPYSLTIKTYNK